MGIRSYMAQHERRDQKTWHSALPPEAERVPAARGGGSGAVLMLSYPIVPSSHLEAAPSALALQWLIKAFPGSGGLECRLSASDPMSAIGALKMLATPRYAPSARYE